MSKNKRLIGIDLARAFAVIGMIVVNFKIVFGEQGSALVKGIASIFEGKAAATFVVLAGLGIALITKRSIEEKDFDKLKSTKNQILKRALLLFILGTSYIVIWPADILHFYGIYMLILLFFISKSSKLIFISSLFLIFIFPLLMYFFDYFASWNIETFDYPDFWTLKGFFRNLFFNGFHPVFPWSAFMMFGYWLGKKDLSNKIIAKKVLKYSAISFISLKLISIILIEVLSEGNPDTKNELTEILGTSPMPPLPFYMLSGTSIAFFIISSAILISDKFQNTFIIKSLAKTGKLALTFYVAHVIIGMGLIEAIYQERTESFSLEFSVLYALSFSFACIIFANIWLKYKKTGPLEWVFRKLIG